MVIIGTNAGKSPPYQLISLITRGIVLVILPTIVLMKDQVCFMLLFYTIVVLNQKSMTICSV